MIINICLNFPNKFTVSIVKIFFFFTRCPKIGAFYVFVPCSIFSRHSTRPSNHSHLRHTHSLCSSFLSATPDDSNRHDARLLLIVSPHHWKTQFSAYNRNFLLHRYLCTPDVFLSGPTAFNPIDFYVHNEQSPSKRILNI